MTHDNDKRKSFEFSRLNSTFKNVTFKTATFKNVTFKNVTLKNVTLKMLHSKKCCIQKSFI